MKKIALIGGYILSMAESNSPAAPQIGSVVIEGNTIVLVTYDDTEVEKYLLDNPDTEVINCAGRVIMPGLINTHSHVSMTLMRNMAEDHELMDWLMNYIWPFEAKLIAEDIATGARLGIAEMLLGGTTTFVDMILVGVGYRGGCR